MRLLPCPFCGTRPDPPPPPAHIAPGAFQVQCPWCGAHGPLASTPGAARFGWNLRVPLAPPEPEPCPQCGRPMDEANPPLATRDMFARTPPPEVLVCTACWRAAQHGGA